MNSLYTDSPVECASDEIAPPRMAPRGYTLQCVWNLSSAGCVLEEIAVHLGVSTSVARVLVNRAQRAAASGLLDIDGISHAWPVPASPTHDYMVAAHEYH